MRTHHPPSIAPLAVLLALSLAGPLTAQPPALDLPTAPTPVLQPSFAERPVDDLDALFEKASALQREAEVRHARESGGSPRAEPSPAVQGLRAEAAGLYKRILAEKRWASGAWHNLALVYRAQGNLPSADRAHQEAIESATARAGVDATSASRIAPYRLAHAETLVQMKKIGDAAAIYWDLAMRHPDAAKPRDALVDLLRATRPSELVPALRALSDAGQGTWAARTAVTLLREGVGRRSRNAAALRTALLGVVARALAAQRYDPEAFPRTETAAQLRPLQRDRTIGPGVAELLQLHDERVWQADRYGWWRKTTAGDDAPRPRDDFRVMLHAMGDWYGRNDRADTAAKCYRLASDLDRRAPDVGAVRRLALLHARAGDAAAVSQLARRAERTVKRAEAEPQQRPAAFDYRATVGRIFGHLATRENRASAWGGAREPTSAIYQLDRARTLAVSLDARATMRPIAGCPDGRCATPSPAHGVTGPRSAKATPHFTPEMAELLATGLEAQGKTLRATTVRLDAAKAQLDADRPAAAAKLTAPVKQLDADALTPIQRQRLRTIDTRVEAAPRTDLRLELQPTLRVDPSTVRRMETLRTEDGETSGGGG
ncbi:MAG: hypothetical protein AAF772_07830 [Acidobacteriota bacterium]